MGTSPLTKTPSETIPNKKKEKKFQEMENRLCVLVRHRTSTASNFPEYQAAQANTSPPPQLHVPKLEIQNETGMFRGRSKTGQACFGGILPAECVGGHGQGPVPIHPRRIIECNLRQGIPDDEIFVSLRGLRRLLAVAPQQLSYYSFQQANFPDACRRPNRMTPPTDPSAAGRSPQPTDDFDDIAATNNTISKVAINPASSSKPAF